MINDNSVPINKQTNLSYHTLELMKNNKED